MLALHELQAAVMQALLTGAEDAERHVVPGRLEPARRLDVYRNNFYENLGSALAAVYPTVAELVGDEFFCFMARRYVRAHPPRTGNLHDFGGDLAVFLEHFEPAAELPYLGDVARLEWAWHCVFHTEAAAPIDAQRALEVMASMPQEAQARARFRWQPSAALVKSAYPVVTLWEWHQRPEEERGVFDMNGAAEAALVRQSAGEVWVHRLTPAEHAVLAGLQRGDTLEAAVSQGLQVDTGIDIAGLLARHLALAVLLEPFDPALVVDAQ
ncbi:MAG TPA: DNA-binding domain-containing protein [Burkholderiaceae bacterium]|nr:DNA-binding domain-containing protein [Burkholderiaceae bacterium]